MYAREQFNMSGNQNQRQVFGNNNGFMRPIVGRKLPVEETTFQMNQGKSTNSYNSVASNSSAPSTRKLFASSASTGPVMAPTRNSQNTATGSRSMAPPNRYQHKTTASPATKPIEYGRNGSQRENRDGNASASASLGLMGMPSPNKYSTKPITSMKTQNDSQVEKTLSRKSGESEVDKLRVLTGTVERVIRYGKIFQNQFCYFQVMGGVVSIAEGKVAFEKTMLLRDLKGPVLQLNYYSNSTHINIDDFYLGQNLRAVGRMIGPNIMSAISIRAASQDEMESLPRLCYISDYSISAFCGERPFESKKN
ncbi:unnamed protein product [Ceutorhynchus assimilis]|uniref:Uncharacterized protein n=1 Tax=Ceutorhynchus assimilis TaxID=467358 RepID=A0A9P0DFG4_9CUCU|nr:unnamed protein product [Ceutorhynchus assimilis]